MSQLFGPLSSGTYAPDNSAYRLAIPWRVVEFGSAAGNGTRPVQEGSQAITSATSDTSPSSVVYLDPADFAVAGLTTKYRVRCTVLTNDTAPGTITFTAGLYPVSASSGAANVIAMTLGTVTSGSTAAIVDPAVSTRNQANSGDFTAPAAGFYALAIVNSAAIAANADMMAAACLQVRNV